jgi:hypothetical protein
MEQNLTLAPQILKTVIITPLGRKNMHDDIPKINQYPAIIRLTFNARVLTELLLYLVSR